MSSERSAGRSVADLTERMPWRTCSPQWRKRSGPVDILVNNAGIELASSFAGKGAPPYG